MPVLTCTPKRLPRATIGEAIDKAVEVNPLNQAPVAALKGLMPGRALSRAHLSILTDRKWRTDGVRLTVGFLDNPPPELRERIMGHMNAWAKTANVWFTETEGTAEVRIAREKGENGGYWSYHGTDILLVKDDQPTMNLEGFTMKTEEADFVRVVRHETGHTLGFPHEHMRRDLVDLIDRQKAIKFFMKMEGWSEQQVIDQVLTPIEDGSILGTARSDSNSIMCYHISADLTRTGEPILGGKDIDEIDYDFAALCYPK